MEENKDYQVYRFDYLTEGSQLKFEHSVYCEDVDISSLITQGTDALEALRQDSIDGEQKAFEIVQAAAKQYAAFLSQTKNGMITLCVGKCSAAAATMHCHGLQNIRSSIAGTLR